MIRAYPIDEKGTRIGEVKSFSDQQWATMQAHFGKKLRYVEVSDGAPATSETTVELISTKGAKRKKKYEE